jgi:hypothetical protein
MERIEPVSWQSPVRIERAPPVERTKRERRQQSGRERQAQPQPGAEEVTGEPVQEDGREHIDVSA